ncbi:topoisomerase I damage affected protein 4 [Echria macrotheca]|uniref:Topoisomerase I damage affected protein 4 n=1 Tax=Echria macrotheca TaxID=438768 RepID=A0AAJ0FDK2_9PEZI|nr:topoisomerase I damage affected protein 4 [Echria macrotheca]
MKDPFPIPPIEALSKAVQPWADRYNLPVLPLHVHEVLGAALFYTFIHLVVSPLVSNAFFPQYYPRARGKKANWDAHVVSLVQSTLINGLALWVMWADDERRQMDWQERVWAYDGASAFIQALAAGYFVWDLIVTLLYIDIFGMGLLAHAVSALAVYTFGFRPYLNYYSTVFILYELSTPFLNIHWFFDKLNMTGSRAQLYNGIALLFTFASCRLVWGSYQSWVVYKDMWQAVNNAPDAGYVSAALSLAANSTTTTVTTLADKINEFPMMFVREATPIPAWLAGVYVVSNLTLNALNWHWFVKMIAAVRKRFETPPVAKEEDGGAKTAIGPDGKPTAVVSGRDGKVAIKHRRQHSIEDVIPDSEELRDGTIQ